MMRKLIYLIWLMMILSACSTTPMPFTTTHTPDPSPTNRAPTLTKVIVPTATATLLATPTLPQGANLIERCPMVDTKSTLQEVTTGTILQDDSLWDIQTGKKYKLPSTSAIAFDHYGLQVSPNRNMLAYIENTSNQQQILWVLDAHASVLAKHSFERNDIEQPRWLDNERLVFYTAQTDQGGSVLVINPFTNQQMSISNELPKILRLQGLRGGTNITWLVEYSPDLRKVVYLSFLDDNIASTFRDISSEKTVWQTLGYHPKGKPVWAPDGQQVAVNSNEKLYLINISGHVQPVLNENASNQWGAILDEVPSWSPDGQKLAFWNKRNLAIYDMKTLQAVHLCIRSEGEAFPDPARWAPDHRQLLVYGFDAQHGNRHSLSFILIDLQKNIAYTRLSTVQNINPDIWMNSLP